MKQNKVLKSLEELSPELLAPEVAKSAETNPGPSELVTPQIKSIPSFQPIGFLTDTDMRAYRGWGINE